MARTKWHDPDNLTPFGRVVQDFMLDQRPNLSVADLADRTGITAQAIHNWLNKGAIPTRQTLSLLAAGTGMSLRALYDAAGYEWPNEEPWLNLIRLIEREQRLPTQARSELVRQIRETQERYNICGPENITEPTPV